MTALVIGRDREVVDACAAILAGVGRVLADDEAAGPAAAAAFDALVEQREIVDVLVTVPGRPVPAPIMRTHDAALTEQLERDLAWQHPVIRRAATAMAERRHGRIVLIGSVGGFTGAALESPYGAAMAGLVGLTRALARELATRQVTVNSVLPGPMESLREVAAASRRLDAHLADIERRTPAGRLCRPADVAEVVAFLASDDASFVTGAIIPVDGGLSMGFG